MRFCHRDEDKRKNQTEQFIQTKPNTMKSLVKIVAGAIFALGFIAQVHAADATGTWTWTQPGRQGGEGRKMTLKLKVDGEKLTGAVTMPGRQGGDPIETAISDGKVKGDEIAFNVVREFNGNKMTTKYSGKVSADAIKGKTEMERNGQANSRDWEAKREK
jgi:hypothetical protein